MGPEPPPDLGWRRPWVPGQGPWRLGCLQCCVNALTPLTCGWAAFLRKAFRPKPFAHLAPTGTGKRFPSLIPSPPPPPPHPCLRPFLARNCSLLPFVGRRGHRPSLPVPGSFSLIPSSELHFWRRVLKYSGFHKAGLNINLKYSGF